MVVFDAGDAHWKFCGTAEFLAGQGKTVTLVTPLWFAGFDLPLNVIPPLYRRLAERQAPVIPSSVVREVTANGVVLRDIFTREEKTLEAEAVVWAGPNRAMDELYKGLKKKVAELYAVGDCVAPRKLDSAFLEGFAAGLRV